MLGFTAGCALGGPRYLAALGEQGDLPARAAAVHPRFGTPAFAIVLSALLAAVLAGLLDFERLVDVTNVVICAQYVATCLSVPRLRGSGGWRLPGGALLPVLGTCATLWLGAQASRGQVLAALAFVAAGFIFRRLCVRLSRC
jgi:APA family basic amino acid/polyamine antiporter